jgi:carbon storage regulator
MLVLSRKVGQQVVLPDLDVTISIVKISGRRVRVGVSAPGDVAVRRMESKQTALAAPEVRARVEAHHPFENGPAEGTHAGLTCSARPSATSHADMSQRIAHAIRHRTGEGIRSLTVNVSSRRILVRGQARTYYATQLAFAAVQDILGTTAAEAPPAVEMDIEVRCASS